MLFFIYLAGYRLKCLNSKEKIAIIFVKILNTTYPRRKQWLNQKAIKEVSFV